MTAPAPTPAAAQPDARGWPAWLAVLAAIAALNVVAVLTLTPAVHRAFASTAGTDEHLLQLLYLFAGLAPVVALLRAALLATFAWCALLCTGADVTFRRTAWPLLTGEVVLTLAPVLVSVTLLLRGWSAIHAPADLGVAQGLDLLLDVSGHPALGAIARHVSPIDALWIGLVGAGLAAIPGVRPRPAALAAAVAWLTMVGFDVLRALAAGGV